jgi:hypothetical protein
MVVPLLLVRCASMLPHHIQPQHSLLCYVEQQQGGSRP